MLWFVSIIVEEEHFAFDGESKPVPRNWKRNIY